MTTKEKQYVSLSEGEERLCDNIRRAVASPAIGLHLIRAQTALGKTEFCCRAISENKDKRFILALQTTRLKEEVHMRLKSMGVQAVMTASIDEPEFLEEVARQIRSCYSMGLSGTMQIIKNYLNGHKNEDNMGTRMCRGYLENKRAVSQTQQRIGRKGLIFRNERDKRWMIVGLE